MKTCRFCQASIEDSATVCFHCGRDQVSGREWTAGAASQPPRPPAVRDPAAAPPVTASTDRGAIKIAGEPAIDPSIARVSVVDIDMPFGSMVGFMVKWSLAAIPALLILGAIMGFAALMLGGLASACVMNRFPR